MYGEKRRRCSIHSRDMGEITVSIIDTDLIKEKEIESPPQILYLN